MVKGKTYKPGQKGTPKGTYAEVNTNGNRTGKQSTNKQPKPLPPTTKKGYEWEKL